MWTTLTSEPSLTKLIEELLPLSSPDFESGPPSIQGVELARVVDRGIRESKVLDFKKLCIEEGEKVWLVLIDIYPLNDDGNIIDAANLGAVVALKNAKMPTSDKEGKIDYEKKCGPLPISKIIPISFSSFKLGDSIILDPTREEEEVCDARVTFGISNQGGSKPTYMINSCQKIGTETFSREELEKIIDILFALICFFHHRKSSQLFLGKVISKASCRNVTLAGKEH